MIPCSEYEGYAEFYDYLEDYRQRVDVPFFVEAAREAGGPVLEVGCGTGRVLIPTARAGVAIEGIDRSIPMLDICRTSLEREDAAVRARVRLFVGDMRDPPVEGPFALITIPFRAFLHLLTVDDQLRTLAALRERLQPGGRLILDVFNPSLPMLADEQILRESAPGTRFTMPDGRRVVRTWRVVSRDYAAQIQQIEFSFEVTDADGRVEVRHERFGLRYMFRYEAEHLLERTGFRVDAVYGDYDRRPFGSTYPGELILVATRR
jgi:SAM-dependent methyltransferase